MRVPAHRRAAGAGEEVQVGTGVGALDVPGVQPGPATGGGRCLGHPFGAASGEIVVGSQLITPPGGGAKTAGAWGMGVWGEFLWGQSWGNNATAIAPGGTTYPGASIGVALTTGMPGLPPGYVLIPNNGPAAIVNCAISAFYG